MKAQFGMILVGFPLLCCLGCPEKSPRRLPPSSVGRLDWLENGLSPAERKIFYHTPEGSEVIPLAFLQALEQADSAKPFMENIERFGFIPDPSNADGLPIGMTAGVPRDFSDPEFHRRFPEFQILRNVRMVGINCAACHVNQIRFNGRTLVVDGAPNVSDISGFFNALVASVEKLKTDRGKQIRFLLKLPETFIRPTTKKVLLALSDANDVELAGAAESAFLGRLSQPIGEPQPETPQLQPLLVPYPGAAMHADARIALLGERLVENAAAAEIAPTDSGALAAVSALDRNLALLDANMVIALLSRRVSNLLSGTDETPIPDPGRVDAFGRARNSIFAPKPRFPTDAPVSYPHLWGFSENEWLHWDANTNSVMERNLGQAIGLGATYTGAPTHASTLLPVNIHILEGIARKIQAPKWPGQLDTGLVEDGKRIFIRDCIKCHSPQPTEPDPSLAEIGTDPNRARNFAKKVDDRPFSEALATELGFAKKWAYDADNVTGADRTAFEFGVRPKWRTTETYPNRPLAGVWATAPYLHNNSVPTLWDLLSKPSDRPKKFKVGHRDFDLKNVGYTKDGDASSREFDTSKSGNHNTGHDYGTNLSDDERRQLIEYLKTL